jgi:hypothetical protein
METTNFLHSREEGNHYTIDVVLIYDVSLQIYYNITDVLC